MAKAKLAKIPDWAVGLILTVAVAVLRFVSPIRPSLDAVNARLFGLRMKVLGPHRVDGWTAIVALDHECITKLGRRPRPRARIAFAVDLLAKKGEPEETAGLQAVEGLELASSVSREVRVAGAKVLREPMDQRLQIGAALRASAARALPPAG